MAAEPIGSAYVIVRAITSQLAKDIKDGLDKGAKDAEVDESGRELGGRLGESTGEGFEETWNERSSEAIRDSADSREMRRATDHFGDSVNERLRDSFDRGGEEASKTFITRVREEVDRGVGDIDVDGSAMRDMGGRMADGASDGFRDRFNENNERTVRESGDNDSMRRGLSGFFMKFGQRLSSGFASAFGDAGKGIGKSFGNFLDSIKFPGGPLIQWGVTLGLPALGAAAQTIGALAGSIISMLGFIGTAALGAGIALAGLGAAVAPAFFILKSAFTIESDDLEAFNLALEGTKERWEEVGLAAQHELLPALSDVFIKLEDLIPMFTTYASELGATVGLIANRAADALTSEENQGKIQRILDAGLPIIRSLGRTLVTMIDPILSILAAAMPLAQKLADAIERVAVKFADFIERKEESGELTETFNLWWERLRTIARIVGNLLMGLVNVFNVGADSATPFFDKLLEMSEKFREFTSTAEGKNTLKTFFDNAWAVANEVFGLIGDIIKLVVAPMGETGGTEGIVNFFKAIREEWLPALVELGTQLGDALKGPAGDFIDILGEFLKSLTESGAGASFFQLFTSNLFVVIKVLEILTGLLGTELGGQIAKFTLGFLVAAKTFKPILKFFKPLGKMFGGLLKIMTGTKTVGAALKVLATGILSLGKALVAFLFANPVVLLIAAIVAAVTLLYFHFKPFREFVDKYIIDPIQRLWEKIGGVQGIIEFFKNVGEAIMNFFKGIANAFKEGGIGGVFDFLVEQLGKLGGLILTGLQELAPLLVKGLGALVSGAANFFRDIGPKVWGWIKEGFSKLADAAGWVWDWLVDRVVDLANAVADVDWGNIAGKVWGWIKDGFSATVGLLSDVGGFIFNWLLDRAVDLANVVADADWGEIAGKVWGWIKDGFSAAGGLLADVGGFIFTWLIDRAVDLANAVADVDWGNIAGKVWGWIKDGFNAYVQAEMFIWGWLIDKVVDLANAVADADWGNIAGKVWGWIKDGFFATVGAIATAAGFIWTWLKDTVLGPVVEGVEEAVTGIADTVWTWIQNGIDEVKDLALGAWDWIFSGLESAAAVVEGVWEGIRETILTVLNGIIEGINFLISGANLLPGIDIPEIPQFDVATGALLPTPEELLEQGQRLAETMESRLPEFGIVWTPDITLAQTPEQQEQRRQDALYLVNTMQSRLSEFGVIWTPQIITPSEVLSAAANRQQIEMAAIVGNWDVFKEEMAKIGVTNETDLRAIFREITGGIPTVYEDTLQGLAAELDRLFMGNLSELAQTGNWELFVEGLVTSNLPQAEDLDFEEMKQIWLALGGDMADVATEGVAQGWAGVTVTGTAGEAVRATPSILAGFFNEGVTDLTPEDFQTVGMVTSLLTSFQDTAEKETRDSNTFKKSADDMSSKLGESLGDKDDAMVAPTNKLVDKILLTLARLVKETEPKVINPWILEMVDGINKTSDRTFDATRKLVDRMILVLAGIPKKAESAISPLANTLVLKMIDAANRVVEQTKKLVDRVVLTIATIPAKADQALGNLTRTLTDEGEDLMEGFIDGVNVGILSLALKMQSLDTTILNNIGDLSNTLYSKGQQLIDGLIRGANDRIARMTVTALSIQAFSRGGIVPGTGPQMAIVHGGEVILNMNQQKALFGGAVGRWTEESSWMLRRAGQSWTWLHDLLQQMKMESGGNPSAINRWDLNWILGHPSMGLMQTIQGTFNAYARDLLYRGILDPWANIYAAINYTLARYGSLGYWRRNAFKGYAEGGIIDGPTFALLGEAGREAVIPLTQPNRALEIMHMAGLDRMVAAKAGPLDGATDVAMLRIDHAEIYDKVDVDIVAAKIRHAYTSLTGKR